MVYTAAASIVALTEDEGQVAYGDGTEAVVGEDLEGEGGEWGSWTGPRQLEIALTPSASQAFDVLMQQTIQQRLFYKF